MRKLNFIFSLSFSLPLMLLGCTSDDVGDEMAEDESEGEGEGDGDGDPTGDGDGDPTGDGDGDPTGDGDGDPTGDGDGDPTGDGDGDPTGDGDGDPTGDGDGDGDTGYCAMGCVEDVDCCPVGSLDCPSEDYPNNYFCSEQGLCEFGGCSEDADCTSGGLFPNMECHPIAEQPTCFEPCENDNDCLLQPGTTCSGIADNGTHYCAAEDEPPGCETDEDCGGAGICDPESGECYCEEDANCTAEGADVCVLN